MGIIWTIVLGLVIGVLAKLLQESQSWPKDHEDITGEHHGIA